MRGPAPLSVERIVRALLLQSGIAAPSQALLACQRPVLLT